MLTASMTTELQPFAMAERLQAFAGAIGITTPKRLYEGMKEAGLDVSFGGIKTIWYGQSVPNLSSAAMICDFLKMSLDYYAWGVEPKPAGFAEIEVFWRNMAAKWGYDNTRSLDNDRAGIVELIRNMTDEQVKVFQALGEGLLSVTQKKIPT